jgi:DNA primase
MLAVGVASRASTGRLIDRFRDRLIFPITHDHRVLGFVARRNPAGTEDAKHGPKYLNTPDTPLFHKGDQLYIPIPQQQATPVLVEGPLDAIAVTLATGGHHVGTAPLGTSLTECQANQLAAMGTEPVVATDADDAGRVAGERDYWLLAALFANPRSARLPEGTDPASLLSDGKEGLLATVVLSAGPMWEEMLSRRLTDSPDHAAAALTVVASAPSDGWSAGISSVAARLGVPSALVRTALPPLVQAWNADPRRAMLALTVDPLPPRPRSVSKRLSEERSAATPDRNRSVRWRPASGRGAARDAADRDTQQR